MRTEKQIKERLIIDESLVGVWPTDQEKLAAEINALRWVLKKE